MPRIPKKLRGNFGSSNSTSKTSGFTTTTIAVPELDYALGLVEQWGSTSPFASMPGFFRLIVVTRQGGITYLSISPYMPTLSEAADYVLSTPVRFQNPDYDEIIGLDIGYLTPENEQRRGERIDSGKSLNTKKPKLPKGYKIDKQGRVRDSKGRFAKVPKRKGKGKGKKGKRK